MMTTTPPDGATDNPDGAPLGWWKQAPLVIREGGRLADIAIIVLPAVALALAGVTAILQMASGDNLSPMQFYQNVGIYFSAVLLATLTFTEFKNRAQQIVATALTGLATLVSIYLI